MTIAASSRVQAALDLESVEPLFVDCGSLERLDSSVKAAAALFGAPLDLTESFRRGAASGPDAIRSMSHSLEAYSPSADRDLRDLSVVDLGNLRLAPALDRALDQIAEAMAETLEHADLGLMVGGEHTASLGAYRGAKRVYPDAVLLQLDAHLDFRTEYEGKEITHASWAYHAGQEFGAQDIIQLGVRSGEREEWPRARGSIAYCSDELALPLPIVELLSQRPLYVTIDIDVLDPAAAPGTGCPEPGGASFREVMQVLHALRDARVIALDVVEVAPELDPAGITAVAAAKLLREAMLLFGGESREQVLLH